MSLFMVVIYTGFPQYKVQVSTMKVQVKFTVTVLGITKHKDPVYIKYNRDKK